VLIAWSAFWLEIPMMEPRVNIAITANLTLIAYLFVLAEMIPQISYLSKIDFFIIGSLILVFLSFWGVILTFIANKKSTKLGNSIQVFFRLLHPCFFILSLIYQFSRM
jgi:hypothetical protein